MSITMEGNTRTPMKFHLCAWNRLLEAPKTTHEDGEGAEAAAAQATGGAGRAGITDLTA